MLLPVIRPRATLLSVRLSQGCVRQYSSTAPKQAPKNRIYPNSVRTENDFEDLILLSASSRVPLITFWGARWCTSCQAVKPLVKGLIEEGFGEEQGGVSFVEIEMDAPTIGGLAMRYQISSMPTLLAFDRSEAQLETKVTRVDDMRNKRFLIEWIEREASRHGEGGAGGGSPFSFLSSIFGRS